MDPGPADPDAGVVTTEEGQARQPVWDGYCADPFVMRNGSSYTMYGTAPGPLADGRFFQTLSSDDLSTWTDVGGALVPLPGAAPGTEYWAPEVVPVDGVYWMYYSAGTGDQGHHLRAATATKPEGPFHDAGVDLTPDLPFAIDPSPFLDSDGSWWLYFATDQLGSERPGTVLAVARMITMSSLGEHRILLTATADWQRYQANRAMYGQVLDWHTLEGPQVIQHEGRYWMCFSAGNWHDPGYGVGLATAAHPQGPWQQLGDRAVFLNSVDTGLIGPGHNSLFTDQAGLVYTAFHAWDEQRTRRSPHLAPIDWTEDGPRVSDSVVRAARRPDTG
jgi:arabinan endo-1,5-alpha-L-arabinosidase